MSKKTAVSEISNHEVANTLEVEKIVSTIEDLKNVFVESNVLPKFTDNKNYVGTASKFSVNLKKTKYNIFMKEGDYELIQKTLGECDGIIYNDATNNSKVRPYYIEVANTTVLRNILKVISTVTGNAIKAE